MAPPPPPPQLTTTRKYTTAVVDAIKIVFFFASNEWVLHYSAKAGANCNGFISDLEPICANVRHVDRQEVNKSKRKKQKQSVKHVMSPQQTGWTCDRNGSQVAQTELSQSWWHLQTIRGRLRSTHGFTQPFVQSSYRGGLIIHVWLCVLMHRYAIFGVDTKWMKRWWHKDIVKVGIVKWSQCWFKATYLVKLQVVYVH